MPRPPALICALLLVAASARASVTVKRAEKSKIDVAVVAEPLSVAIKALQLYLPHPAEVAIDSDPEITFRAKRVTPQAALNAMVLEAGMAVIGKSDRYVVMDPRVPTVTLDVKDADVREILKSMQEQCGIKNLVLDPDVHGSGTFLFREVPCHVAFDMVLRTTGLGSVVYPNSVLAVSAKR